MSDSYPLPIPPTDGVHQLFAQVRRIAGRAGAAVDGRTEIDVHVLDDHVVYLADGSFLGLEVALQALQEVLPHIVEVLAVEHEEPALIAIADALLLELTRCASETLRVADEMIQGRPFAPALPPQSGGRIVDHQIAAYRAAILAGVTGRLAPATVLEEIHSTVEGLLRAAITKPAYKFPSLVEQAKKAALVQSEDVDAILAMNKLRVRVKHRGVVAGPDEVIGHYLATLPVVFDLARVTRRKDVR